MKKIINIIPAGVFSVIATGIVVYLLLVPASEMERSLFSWLQFKHSDKLIHFLLFFFLNLVYLYDYTKYKAPRHTRINIELAFTAFASMIGLLTESCQLAMGLGRVFDYWDIVADVAGAFAALGLMRWFGGHVLRKYLFYRSHRHRHHRHHHYSSKKKRADKKNRAETTQNG
ncbi:MAG: VanZ family protein [Muribaculaceae bacterium]|nr:VanZ family protein [Muribaculaceae bacterium]